jgi:hypothetical protein
MSLVATSGIPVRREMSKGLVQARLQLDPVALQLEPEVLRPEEVAQLDRRALGLGELPRLHEVADLAREAAREALEALGVTREGRLVDARAEGVALEVRGRRELEEVLVAATVAREQRQVVVGVLRLVVRFPVGLARDVDLAPDQRLQTGLARLLVEPGIAPEQVAVVCEGERARTVGLAAATRSSMPGSRPVQQGCTRCGRGGGRSPGCFMPGCRSDRSGRAQSP